MLTLLSSLAFAAPTLSDAQTDQIVQDLQDAQDNAVPAVPVGPRPIINGTPYDTDEWPETGALVAKLELRYGAATFEVITSICSSTLIAPDVVLLAAHCVDETTLQYSMPQNATLLELAFDREADLSSYQFGNPYNAGVVVASSSEKHPDFSIFNFNSFDALGVSKNDDIALLFLEEAVFDVPHAYLPTETEIGQIAEGNEVEIVGWGQRDPSNPYTAGIKYGGVSDLTELGDHEFQVGGASSAVRKCHGDSGGPTFMEFETDSSEATRVIGVTSHSYDFTDCASKGGVDTRVDAYLTWIDATMREKCDDGTRVWCDDWQGIVEPPDADGFHAWEENPADINPFGDDDDDDDDEDGLSDGDDGDSESAGGCNTVSGAGVAGMLVAPLALWGRRR